MIERINLLRNRLNGEIALKSFKNQNTSSCVRCFSYALRNKKHIGIKNTAMFDMYVRGSAHQVSV